MPVEQTTQQSDSRAVEAARALATLAETDVLLKFNNGMLAAEMEDSLRHQFSASKQLELQSVRVDFHAQFIQLSAKWQIFDDQGEMLIANTTGEVQLEPSGDGLEWFPVFDQIEVLSSDFKFAEGSYAEAIPELNQQLLRQVNSGLKMGLSSNQLQRIPFQPVPLAHVEVGARLLSFSDATSVKSAPVQGMFFVTGSAVLIQARSTSVLMDLSFKPNLATCPADITVSRAMFAEQIDAREPVSLAQNLGSVEDLKFFYSEISGATRPMTIVHYWFADGQPVAVEELPIGPSDRWRTWSTKGEISSQATHWRVLVVDKESGCVLHSQSIRTLDPGLKETRSPTGQGVFDFATYHEAFAARMSDFPSAALLPDIGITEVRRAFFRDVIQAGIDDMQIETVIDHSDLPPGQYHADLLPFETRNIVCEDHKCADPLVCSANIAHCKRLRDTRECSSCLFHNPLNNRCMHMEEDPMCVAAKNRQNAIYESDQASCIAAAEASRQNCQQLSMQITQSCEIETSAEKSACEASKTGIETLDPGAMLASVSANSQVSGQMRTLFSKFSISGDFEQLQQNVTLKTRLDLNGQLDFETGNTQWPLSSCINAWKGPFSNRVVSSTALNSMLAPLTLANDGFTAAWSGIVLPLTMTASPLESVFVSNPRLLASCSIGLTVKQVEQAILGQDADFFTGGLKLIIQPLPTRIELNPLKIELAGNSYSGSASSSPGFISYRMNADLNIAVQ